MRCEEAKRLLPEYSIGALRGRKARDVKRHIQICPDCRGELAALRKTGEMIENLPLERPPANIWDSIATQIEAESQARAMSPWRRWLKPTLIPAWAALALMGLIAWIYLGVIRSPQQEVQPLIPLELKQHVVAAWDSPFSDTAALALYIGEEIR
ncbi:TPA: hypothetical protein EYP37_13570 [Candidatus Poribacteria bacterium]|nr:hypothetical protein [Candidatus Poribacteria bacterium]